jgi:glutamate formiminotransferase
MAADSLLVQSAINVSEGRDPAVIRAVVAAAESVPGLTVADWSADWDHNRMVVTLLGAPEAVSSGALAVAREAVRRIDLRGHAGAHPRMGAVDVIPFAPIRAVSMETCAALSRQVGLALAAELGLPVYLYEASAAEGRRSALPDIRKGGFEGLFTGPLAGPRAPDYGPAAPHPTAGAVVVGARGPLVANNVNLDSGDVSAAKRVAAAIRADRAVNPALAGVRALGLALPSRGLAQVSLNLTRPALTPIPPVFDFIRASAANEGVTVRESEVIGLIPRAALGGEPPERVLWRDFRETQLLDYWMERL